MPSLTPRVLVTEAATAILDRLIAEHGPLLFHQSGGCCDGSAPMCYSTSDFRIGSSDVWLGTIHGCPFFMSGFQFEYWQYTQLTVDVVPGRGSSFSLEIPLGVRFLIHSRVFTDDELPALEPVQSGEAFVGG